MALETKTGQDEIVDEIMNKIEDDLALVLEPERSERIKAASDRVLVRDCEGKFIDMIVASSAGSLVYVTRNLERNDLCAIGVPAEDVFEFTRHPETKILPWVQNV